MQIKKNVTFLASVATDKGTFRRGNNYELSNSEADSFIANGLAKEEYIVITKHDKRPEPVASDAEKTEVKKKAKEAKKD